MPLLLHEDGKDLHEIRVMQRRNQTLIAGFLCGSHYLSN